MKILGYLIQWLGILAILWIFLVGILYLPALLSIFGSETNPQTFVVNCSIFMIVAVTCIVIGHRLIKRAGLDENPEKNNRLAMAILFVFFILLGLFIFFQAKRAQQETFHPNYYNNP